MPPFTPHQKPGASAGTGARAWREVKLWHLLLHLLQGEAETCEICASRGCQGQGDSEGKSHLVNVLPYAFFGNLVKKTQFETFLY